MEDVDTSMSLLKAAAALIFVLGLMGGLAYILRRMGLSGPALPKSDTKRLKVVESTPIDARRRLVLVQRDDVQHLIILGVNGETVIETNVPPKDN